MVRHIDTNLLPPSVGLEEKAARCKRPVLGGGKNGVVTEGEPVGII